MNQGSTNCIANFASNAEKWDFGIPTLRGMRGASLCPAHERKGIRIGTNLLAVADEEA